MAPIYHLRLKDQTGAVSAILTHWLSLTYTKRVNSVGSYTLMLDGDDSRVSLFALDAQIEVWRADPAQSIAWYADSEFLHRSTTRERLVSGEHRFTSAGRGYNDLLGRRIIAAAAGSAGAEKAGVAETVAKEYVDEQAGPGAGVRALYGFTVQADAAQGNSITFKRARRNLLEVLQEIALVGGGDFAVVGTGAAAFAFRWYDGQLGTDRTVGNSGGNPSVIFAVEFGNMGQPRYALSRLDEVNAVYVGGQGEGATRTVNERTDAAAIAASPWNRREAFRDARNESAAAGLNARGDEELESAQAKESFSFEVLQVPSCLYGKHYFLGDLVTGRFGTVQVDKKVLQVTVNVAAQGQGGQIENISVELADV